MAIPTLNNYAMPSQWKANKVNWSLEPKRAALLIHDMQEYFTAFYGENSPLIAALTERLAAVRKQCKALGIPVFYTAQPKHQSPEDRALLESMAAFAAGVEQMEITHLDLPTAFWNEWVVALTAGQAHIPASLATVIIGGEAVYPELLAQWQRQGRHDVRLFNTYGPTETTVVVTT